MTNPYLVTIEVGNIHGGLQIVVVVPDMLKPHILVSA